MQKSTPSRRDFLLTVGTASVALSNCAPVESLETQPPSPVVIDIHQHTTYRARTNEQLFTHQRRMGITKTVLLPAGSPVSRPSTHDGASNGLDGGISGNQSCLQIVEADPDHYAFFANEVPDLPTAQTEIESYLNKGAIGIGEQKFSVDCDSAHIELIASIAREYDVPVLMHFEHDRYNLGIERFRTILEKFPTVNFIGHAQTWWGNIDAAHDQTILYPEGPITPGGISDRYLSDYANMFGDLSANSGRNSIMRDEDHAREFLVRHQDKLMYGSDCDDTIGEGEECIGSRTLGALRRLVDDDSALQKILSGNAQRIIRP